MVKSDLFLKEVCEKGERILITKQEGIVSEIRGHLAVSVKEDWVTLKMAHCRCHIHMTLADLRTARFTTKVKEDGTSSYGIEFYSEDERILLKIYLPSAPDGLHEKEYHRLKEIYGSGERIFFS